MEFYFPEKKKKIKMTIAVWLKIKRLENESKRSYTQRCQPSHFLRETPVFSSISRFPVLLANLPIFRIFKKIIIIIITDPDNRHYRNLQKRYNLHITCQIVCFYNKSKLNMKPLYEKGANKQLRFEIFTRDSRKILVGPKCP